MRYFVDFFVFSFLGWIIDSAYSSIVNAAWIPGGVFKTFELPIPLAPIYGLGALILIFGTRITKKWAEWLRVLSLGVAMVVLEYLGGVLSEIWFGRMIWDYSDNFMNLNGYIDLFHSVVWVVFVVIFLYVLPSCLDEKVNKK